MLSILYNVFKIQSLNNVLLITFSIWIISTTIIFLLHFTKRNIDNIINKYEAFKNLRKYQEILHFYTFLIFTITSLGYIRVENFIDYMCFWAWFAQWLVCTFTLPYFGNKMNTFIMKYLYFPTFGFFNSASICYFYYRVRIVIINFIH